MTAEKTDDVDRRARQVRVTAQQIETTLARRPGAVPDSERRDVLTLLNSAVMSIPGLSAASRERQLDAAEGFLALWLDLLNEFDTTGLPWMDPDDDGDDR